MMKTLLLACYELGHQPLSLAWPAAVLRQAGLDVIAVDLSVEEFPTEDAATADLVAVAAPMHTALRLGVEAARRVRALNPQAHVCFFGLYAWLNADYLLHSHNGDGPPLADSVIAGEAEPVLRELALALAQGASLSGLAGVTTRTHAATPHLARMRFPAPIRDGLPGLARYARYMEDGVAHLAGYTEASRGCLHTCRHCPVVPIYRGRFFVVPVETVLADIAQQVEAGARHITFGDPDFLNGPGHARRVARALHATFPQISFDFTTKVEHILEHPDLVAELAKLGATFAISAFESVSDHVLARLDKGHTVADMEAALAVVRRAGLAIQPTWVPFTPWTTLDDYLAMLTWIRRHGLIPATPAVQLSIRLLIPPGSALLDGPDVDAWLGPLEAENFTYAWRHPDPRMDALQQQVAAIAEAAGEDGDPQHAFRAVEEAAWTLAGLPLPPAEPVSGVAPPRLTEHWFC
ncbi:MAG: radical SAM protein [Caldilineae bacterium]|nr:MAG: radical SAM protein [Caldilineae bacterium]